VFLHYGHPIVVPQELDGESVAVWQEQITRAQDEATTVCEEAVARTRKGRA
jgi:hypothetical protein